jgi:predicted lipoprotein with Yx(FWY)xxD motif
MRKILGAAGLAALALALSACASSSSSSSAASNPPASNPAASNPAASNPAASNPAAGASSPAASAPASSASGTTLKMTTIDGTAIVTNAQGRTLYWFVPDTSTTSKCTGSCATYWPPVLGPVTAGTGVTGMLGTITRPGGTMQATYDGHPLYTYAGDSAPGQAKGNGINASGGLWYEMTVSGAKPATTTSTNTGTSTGTGTGGGTSTSTGTGTGTGGSGGYGY